MRSSVVKCSRGNDDDVFLGVVGGLGGARNRLYPSNTGTHDTGLLVPISGCRLRLSGLA